MPSFLKDLSLRRRSKTIVPTDNAADASSGNTSSNDGNSEDQPPRPNKSSSTLSSFFDRENKQQQSPPTTLSSQKSRSSTHLPGSGRNGNKTPPLNGQTPRMPSSHSGSGANRYSLAVSEEKY